MTYQGWKQHSLSGRNHFTSLNWHWQTSLISSLRYPQLSFLIIHDLITSLYNFHHSNYIKPDQQNQGMLQRWVQVPINLNTVVRTNWSITGEFQPITPLPPGTPCTCFPTNDVCMDKKIQVKVYVAHTYIAILDKWCCEQGNCCEWLLNCIFSLSW